jgi:hypothetical protein
MEKTAIEQLSEVFADSFMQPYIEECDYFEVETEQGVWFIPARYIGYSQGKMAFPSQLRDFVEGALDIPNCGYWTPKHGWLCRLSAPGYMDCTEWWAFDSEEEAAQYLIDMYGDE